MPGDDDAEGVRPRRSDARRNQEALLAAAAAEFVRSGVDAPVRDIAARAGVGVGTVYRHYPTRAELVVDVYRHQVQACARAGPELLASEPTALAALRRWVETFVDFLVTKHGLPDALGRDEGFEALHSYFLDELVPVCDELLTVAADAGEIVREGLPALELMRAIGNLCIGAPHGPDYDVRRVVAVLVAGLTVPRRRPTADEAGGRRTEETT